MSSANYLEYYQPAYNKGNILQYKGNSANLTKNQRYSKIAKRQWTNRTTTWATQSQIYTNPNTSSLARIGQTYIPTPARGYVSPIDCSGGTGDYIEDGGVLDGTLTINQCTGAVIQKVSPRICNLSTDCDVPGTPIVLCWNDKNPTWFPRQRLTMPTSGGKFPVNYKMLRSANSISPDNYGGVGSY
jgi:hypothetical protein